MCDKAPSERYADIVKDILSMNTGSHTLGAFDIDFHAIDMEDQLMAETTLELLREEATSPPVWCPHGIEDFW